MKLETTVNVVSKINEAKKSLNEVVVIQSVFAIVRDSCNGMRDVRRVLVEKKNVK